MAQKIPLEEQLRTLTKRFEDLKDQVNNPPPKPIFERIFSWDMLRNIMVIVGIPVAFLSAWTVVDEQFLRYREIDLNTRLPVALDSVEQLQSFNAEYYAVQAREGFDAATAHIEAKRGRVERLIKGVMPFLSDYPDELTLYEILGLTEGLITFGLLAEAIAIVDSVDETGLNEIDKGDLDLLRARIFYQNGPTQDPEAARDALRDATAHADQVENKAISNGLLEKYASVRVLNDLWLDVPCEEVAPLAEVLREISNDGTPPQHRDAVRQNTILVVSAYDDVCPAG